MIRYLSRALLALALVAIPAQAQGWKDRLKDKAKDRAAERADQGADKALDKTEDAIKCAASDKACIDKAKKGGKTVEITEDRSSPAAGAQQGKAAAPAGENPADKLPPGQGIWANFDFVPGEKVLYADDFSRDRVGNFPKRLDLINGASEIVEWKGGRWLRVAGPTQFRIKLAEALPKKFTLEFDATIPWWGMAVTTEARTDWEAEQSLSFGTEGNYKSYVVLEGTGAGIARGGGRGQSAVDPRDLVKDLYPESSGEREETSEITVPMRFRLQVDGSYAKLYMNEHRIANMPNADFARSKEVVFIIGSFNADKGMPMIGNISLNAGGKDLYDALMADGRVAMQGIYFDVGSDRIRPESSGQLKEVADMLLEHPELKLTVEGHTDNVGDAAANQTLSDKRAAAVKVALTTRYKVPAAQLGSKGYGASRPAAPNTTPEGRQQNRRVELVKM